MADSISPVAGYNPNFTRQFNIETVGGDQRARLAEMLRSNALNAPQGQMVSGWYVPPSWSQNLAQLANTAVGVLGGKALDEERAKKTAEALKRFEGVEEPVPMQNIPGVSGQGAAMAEGQSRPEGAPMQSQGVMMQQPQTRMRPLTQDEQDMALLNLAQINPQVGQIYGTLLGTRTTRAERAAEKAEQRAWQEHENEKNRQSREDMIRLSAGFAAANRVAPQDKPLTEYQGKAVTFGTRAAQSHNILNALEQNVNPVSVAASRKGGMFVNWALDPQTRQVEQAQRDFINAVLRQESGAAIGQNEYESAARQYFPEPGDPPEVVAQKRASREAQIRGFAKQAGPAGMPDIINAFNTPYALPTSKEEKPTGAGRLGNQSTLPPSAQQGGWGIRPKQ